MWKTINVNICQMQEMNNFNFIMKIYCKIQTIVICVRSSKSIVFQHFVGVTIFWCEWWTKWDLDFSFFKKLWIITSQEFRLWAYFCFNVSSSWKFLLKQSTFVHQVIWHFFQFVMIYWTFGALSWKKKSKDVDFGVLNQDCFGSFRSFVWLVERS